MEAVLVTSFYLQFLQQNKTMLLKLFPNIQFSALKLISKSHSHAFKTFLFQRIFIKKYIYIYTEVYNLMMFLCICSEFHKGLNELFHKTKIISLEIFVT